ncbi:uncharacterized protein LOC122242649 [Penaeus japonicus]|uniref:uncharacterized protein LOC122242649 n=1 Tax=Penaeus japonicus TaxID=27405 RepID=UPI001C70DDC8|nr:uncharacterized protein LOC122242649 [Penaeus japonicus]
MKVNFDNDSITFKPISLIATDGNRTSSGYFSTDVSLQRSVRTRALVGETATGRLESNMDRLLYTTKGAQPKTLWLPRPGRVLARNHEPYRRFHGVIRTVHLEDAIDICVERRMTPRPVSALSRIKQNILSRHHPCRSLEVLWFGTRSDQDDEDVHDWYGNVQFSFPADVFLDHFAFCFLVEILTAPTHTATRLLITNSDYSSVLDPYSPYRKGGPWYVNARGEHFALRDCARFNDQGFNRHPHELEFMVEMTPHGQHQILKEAEISFRNHEAAIDLTKPRTCHRYQRFPSRHQACPWALSAAVASQRFFSLHQEKASSHPNIASPRLSTLADYFRQCYLMAEQSKVYPWLVLSPEPHVQQMISTLSPVPLNAVEEKLWSASTAKVLLQVGDQFHVVDRSELISKSSLFTGSQVSHSAWKCVTWNVIDHIYQTWVLTHEVYMPLNQTSCNGHLEAGVEFDSTKTLDNSFIHPDFGSSQEVALSEYRTQNINHLLPNHYQNVSQQQPDHYQNTSQQQPGHYQNTSQQQPGHYQNTSQQQPGHYQNTSQQQPGHYQNVSQQQPDHYQNTSQPHTGHNPSQAYSACQQTGTPPTFNHQQKLSSLYPDYRHQPHISCHQSAKQPHDPQNTVQPNDSHYQEKTRSHIRQQQNTGQSHHSHDKRVDSSQRPPSSQASRGLSQKRNQVCIDDNITDSQPTQLLTGSQAHPGRQESATHIYDQNNNRISPVPHDKIVIQPQQIYRQKQPEAGRPPRSCQNASHSQEIQPAPSWAQIVKTQNATRKRKPLVMVRQVQDVICNTTLSRSYAQTLTISIGQDITLTQKEEVNYMEFRPPPRRRNCQRVVFRNSPSRRGSHKLFMYVTNLHPDTEKEEFEAMMLRFFPQVQQINARKYDKRHYSYCSFTAVIKGDNLFEEDFMDADVFPPPIWVNVEQWKPRDSKA